MIKFNEEEIGILSDCSVENRYRALLDILTLREHSTDRDFSKKLDDIAGKLTRMTDEEFYKIDFPDEYYSF